MDILRVPTGSYLTYTRPSSGNMAYTVTDLSDSSIVISEEKVPPIPSPVTISLSSIKYDGEYVINIDNWETDGTQKESSEIYFSLTRPYVDPNDKGTTASEIAAYASNEELARAIIDACLPDQEFYYRKKVIETTGQGVDYLPIWVNAKEILKVYENNVLLYDIDDLENSVTDFEIIGDGSAITMKYNDAINRDESARILLPASPTDIAELDYSARGFPKGWDYKVVLTYGYHKVPADIKRATELLVHDIDCGKLDYYKRYIGAYNTDQFRIQFDKAVFNGTGNLIVDKILSKYEKSINFVGVL